MGQSIDDRIGEHGVATIAFPSRGIIDGRGQDDAAGGARHAVDRAHALFDVAAADADTASEPFSQLSLTSRVLRAEIAAPHAWKSTTTFWPAGSPSSH